MLYNKFNGSPFLTIDNDVAECWNANQILTGGSHISPGNSNRLNSLIQSASSDCLISTACAV